MSNRQLLWIIIGLLVVVNWQGIMGTVQSFTN